MIVGNMEIQITGKDCFSISVQQSLDLPVFKAQDLASTNSSKTVPNSTFDKSKQSDKSKNSESQNMAISFIDELSPLLRKQSQVPEIDHRPLMEKIRTNKAIEIIETERPTVQEQLNKQYKAQNLEYSYHQVSRHNPQTKCSFSKPLNFHNVCNPEKHLKRVNSHELYPVQSARNIVFANHSRETICSPVHYDVNTPRNCRMS